MDLQKECRIFYISRPHFFSAVLQVAATIFCVTGSVLKSNLMKSLGIWATVVLLCAVVNGCKKKMCLPVAEPPGLYGRWHYAAYYLGIGPPGEWHPVPVTGQWIELRSDGSFSSNFIPYLAAHSYHLTDSVHIKLIIQDGSDSLLYRFSKRGDTLELSPYAPLCIEVCADRFLK